jgi:hypothetical protein
MGAGWSNLGTAVVTTILFIVLLLGLIFACISAIEVIPDDTKSGIPGDTYYFLICLFDFHDLRMEENI